MKRRNRIHARVRGRRASEAGLSLIELLVSLALLAVLTGFTAGGLSMARRAFGADQTASLAGETDRAVELLSALIGSALPVSPDAGGRAATVRFDGDIETVSFVGLSEGHALRAGPQAFMLRRNASDLVVDVIAETGGGDRRAAQQPPIASSVILTGVKMIRLGYFGITKPKANVASWQSIWRDADHLPGLVSIQIEFQDERRNVPPVLVALRQS